MKYIASMNSLTKHHGLLYYCSREGHAKHLISTYVIKLFDPDRIIAVKSKLFFWGMLSENLQLKTTIIQKPLTQF